VESPHKGLDLQPLNRTLNIVCSTFQLVDFWEVAIDFALPLPYYLKAKQEGLFVSSAIRFSIKWLQNTALSHRWDYLFVVK
jgi:hypothetical protein